jgi:hypothetical protein
MDGTLVPEDQRAPTRKQRQSCLLIPRQISLRVEINQASRLSLLATSADKMFQADS